MRVRQKHHPLRLRVLIWGLWIVAICVWPAHLRAAGDLSGYIVSEFRYFPEPALDPRQFNGANWSVAAQPEYYREWDDARQSFTFVPFARLDQHDSKRTHADIRELNWLKASNSWEIRLGIGKVFWGVTEFLHLVDIVNQTDLVENIDAEDKLGQPMANLTFLQDWGTVDLFLLPYFRQRTFPGVHGRLRSIPYVDTDQAQFESSAEEKHVDFAARWSHVLGDWDIGVSHFFGTSRDPRFFPGVDSDGSPVLIPFYDIINQTSLDVQATKGSWLWKFEGFTRGGQEDRFIALTGGFEYTFFGAFGTSADVGVLSEYVFDERGEDALTLFEDDIFVGTRLTLNDEQSTQLLAGAAFDRKSAASFLNVEASRRLADHWVLNLEARAFSKLPPRDIRSGIRNDDYVQIELFFYF